MSTYWKHRWLWITALAACLATGCEEAPQRRTPTEADYELPDGDDELSKLKRTFQHYEGLAAKVNSSPTVELFEGLPHPTWEEDLLAKETEHVSHVELAGWAFYSEPCPLTAEDANRLKRLFCSRDSFVPFVGWAGCGGFHPDWCLKWTDGDQEVVVHLCFGCCEMKATDGTVELIGNFTNKEDFENILKAYRNQRPRSDHYPGE